MDLPTKIAFAVIIVVITSLFVSALAGTPFPYIKNSVMGLIHVCAYVGTLYYFGSYAFENGDVAFGIAFGLFLIAYPLFWIVYAAVSSTIPAKHFAADWKFNEND